MPVDERTLELPARDPRVESEISGLFASGNAPALLGKQSSRFEVVSTLGSGGFGVVYLAKDLETASMVALKTIPAERAQLKYRLKREFRALADLKHRNLVSFYELFAEEDPIFFTMEYVPGTTFLRYVRPRGLLREQRLREAFAQLVRGVAALHGAGKLHRDIKPSNVLVAPDGRVVLLDLGLVTEAKQSGLGESIDFAGTPEYMSPEHASGAPVSAASDWYSVGVMLYEALTGRPPFQGTWQEILAQQQRRAPLEPQQLAPRVPQDLSSLAMSLLAQDAHARPHGPEITAVLGHEWVSSEANEILATGTPLVGRHSELERLSEALAVVRAGTGVTILLEGKSGIGKTSLADHFLAEAQRDGETIILHGRCYERERVPYQGIDSLIDDLCRFLSGRDRSAAESMLPRNVAALVRLFPLLERVPAVADQADRNRFASVSQQEMRRLAFGALRELLARVAERSTLILHIDDLQWGDLDTAALLRELLHPPDAPPMLLILAFRSEDRETSPCLKALVSEDLGPTIGLQIGPLAKDDADSLLRTLLPLELPENEVASLTSQAEGNPLFIRVMARFVTDRDTNVNPGARLDLAGALGSRISALPPRARALLETIVLAGHPITELLARRAAGLVGSAWAEWDVLSGQHLVRSSGTSDDRTSEPFHDRIREAVLSVLSPERSSECHRLLAQALEQIGSADPDVLARHHLAAGNIERALHFTVEAAGQADRALAFERAASLFERAITLTAPMDPRRATLLAARGEALANAGRCEEAASTFREAAELEQPKERILLLRRAAEQLLFGGQIDQARELIRVDLRAAGFPLARNPKSAMVSLLLHRLHLRFRNLKIRARSAPISPEQAGLLEHIYKISVGLSGVDVLIGGEMAVRYMLRALDAGDPRSIALGLCLITGHGTIEAPSSRRTLFLLKRTIEHGAQLSDPAVNASVYTVQGLQAYFAGDWRRALGYLDAAEKLINEECHSLVWELWTGRAVAIWCLFFLGEWAELERRVSTLLREARDRGNLYATQCVTGCFGISAFLARGNVEEARRSLDEVTLNWQVSGFQLQYLYFMIADSFISLFSGKGPEAWAQLNRRWNVVAKSALTLRFPMLRAQELHVRGCCALAAASSDSSETPRWKLLREAGRAADRLDSVKLAHSHLLAELLRAGLAAQSGRRADALRHLDAAAPGLDAREMRVYAAAARRLTARMKGEPVPDFLPGQPVANPEAITQMLVPGFSRHTAQRS